MVRVRATVRVKFEFMFYVYFVSTKPTALSSCVTVTSHVVYEFSFQISRSTDISTATAFSFFKTFKIKFQGLDLGVSVRLTLT